MIFKSKSKALFWATRGVKKNGNINKELKLLLKKPHDLNEIINKKFNK